MTTKQKDLSDSIRQAFTVLVVLALSVIFAASCAQVAPADTVAKATPTAEPANPEADKAAVRKFFDDHGAAMARVDTATLHKMWADDVVLIDHEGNTLTKQQWTDLLTTGTEKIEEGDPSSNTTDVRIYGNTAVAVLKVTQKASLKGESHSGRMTIGAVLVKGDQGWRMVLAQLSELKPVAS
ncbi:MAG: nuclear transport factor 2 family protein [Pyrinomonadaceae bacterium]